MLCQGEKKKKKKKEKGVHFGKEFGSVGFPGISSLLLLLLLHPAWPLHGSCTEAGTGLREVWISSWCSLGAGAGLGGQWPAVNIYPKSSGPRCGLGTLPWARGGCGDGDGERLLSIPAPGSPFFLWRGQWGCVGFVPFQLRREPLGLRASGGAGAGVGEEARRQGQWWPHAAGCPAEFEIVPGAACNRGLAMPRGAPPALHLTNVGRRARGSRGLAPTPCVCPPVGAAPCHAVLRARGLCSGALSGWEAGRAGGGKSPSLRGHVKYN